jgi:hypothetical protein
VFHFNEHFIGRFVCGSQQPHKPAYHFGKETWNNSGFMVFLLLDHSHYVICWPLLFLPDGPPLTFFVNDRFEENLPRFDY